MEKITADEAARMLETFTGKRYQKEKKKFSVNSLRSSRTCLSENVVIWKEQSTQRRQ